MLEIFQQIPEADKHPRSYQPTLREIAPIWFSEKVKNLIPTFRNRGLVITSAAVAAATVAQPAIEMIFQQTSEVEAAPLEQMVIRERPWNVVEKNWRPLSAAAARQHPGTSTLHEIGGPLHTYDLAHQRFYGWATDARGDEEANALQTLAAHPDIWAFAGYCRELAIVGLMEDEPNDFLAPELQGLINGPQELRAFKVGLLIALNTTTPTARIGFLRGNDRSDINQVLNSFSGGQNIIINAPEARVSGDWFRALYGLDDGNFLASNFGYDPRAMSRNLIKSAQALPSREDNPKYAYGNPISGSPTYIDKVRSSGLRLNKELNYNFAYYLVNG